METRKILVVLIFSLGFLIPQAAAAYAPHTTHAALAEEAVKLFNSASRDTKIESREAEDIIRGSIDEDAGTRALHHFFDPVLQRGLVLSPSAARDFELVALSFSSSKDWAKNSKEQAGADAILLGTILPYFSAGTDFSWPRAIYDYAWGDRARGLTSLGHILHLIADAAVPDHTRNDPHPPYAEAWLHQSSPYEKWAGQFDKANIEDKGAVRIHEFRAADLESLDAYFTETATYSNNNFFSKDTIQDSVYEKPVIAREIKKTLTNGLTYGFGLDAGGSYLAVVAHTFDIESGEITKSYSLVDPDSLVLGTYWARLSQKAVENAAGVIGLFLKEVEHERTSRRLLELNRSWLEKAIKALVDFGRGIGDEILGFLAAIGMGADTAKTYPPAAEELLKRATLPVKPDVKPDKPLTDETPASPDETAALESAEAKVSDPDANAALANPPTTELSPPPLGRFIGGSGAPPPTAELTPASIVSETALSSATSSETALLSIEATSTATTTLPATATSTPATSTPIFFEEISPGDEDDDAVPPNVSLILSGCEAAATSTCFIAATSTAISWSSTSTDVHHFNLDCRYESSTCPGIPTTSPATSTLEFTGTTSIIYIFFASAADFSGNQSPTTTKMFQFILASASTTELASTTESSIITESASATESEMITESASTTETSTATTTAPTADPAPTGATGDTASLTAVKGDAVSDEEPSSTDALDSPSANTDSGDTIEGPTAAELAASSTAP